MKLPTALHCARLTSPPTVTAALHPDGVVFLDHRSGRIYVAGAVGATIWQQLQRSVAVAEILRSVHTSFGVSRERAESDVLRFIEALVDARLLELRPRQ